jgi:hypothetical protein
LVDCLHLVGPARDRRQRPAGAEAHDFRVHALHAQPHHRIHFYIPADQVVELPISADEAAKLIMSAGLVQPQGQAALAAMAEAAKLAKPTLATEASGAGS